MLEWQARLKTSRHHEEALFEHADIFQRVAPALVSRLRRSSWQSHA